MSCVPFCWPFCWPPLCEQRKTAPADEPNETFDILLSRSAPYCMQLKPRYWQYNFDCNVLTLIGVDTLFISVLRWGSNMKNCKNVSLALVALFVISTQIGFASTAFAPVPAAPTITVFTVDKTTKKVTVSGTTPGNVFSVVIKITDPLTGTSSFTTAVEMDNTWSGETTYQTIPTGQWEVEVWDFFDYPNGPSATKTIQVN